MTNTVEIVEQNKTVSIAEDGKTVVVDEANLNVVSVGTQGPTGPAGSAEIGSKSVEDGPPLDGEILIYNSSADQWQFTAEIDAGTY